MAQKFEKYSINGIHRHETWGLSFRCLRGLRRPVEMSWCCSWIMRALYILLLFYYTVLLQWEGLTNCIIYSCRICIHHIRIILMYMIIEYIIINNYIITIMWPAFAYLFVSWWIMMCLNWLLKHRAPKRSTGMLVESCDAMGFASGRFCGAHWVLRMGRWWCLSDSGCSGFGLAKTPQLTSDDV